MSEMSEMSELMTSQQVADYLRIHVVTVTKLAREGKIPGLKLGNQWRFRRDLLEDWIESGSAPEMPENFFNLAEHAEQEQSSREQEHERDESGTGRDEEGTG